MKHLVTWLTCAVLCGATSAAGAEPDRPNIVVILSDDQGYADISFNPHHPREVSTPRLDALAREGVWFSQGYISGAVCSPTRAGLMLGRYQQRVGVYTAGEGGRGFDPSIPIFPAMLPDDYASIALGKWHLGLDDDYPSLRWHPVNRGFDESYNFMGRGGHDYFKLAGATGSDETGPLYRGTQRIDDHGYLTTRLAEEAVDFIGRNKERPFFVYLAFNAVHSPAQAPQETIDRVKAEYPDLPEARQVLMAMLHHLDQSVGSVVDKLKAERVWDNTLLFFLTDNGGSKAMSAVNTPLRGFKQDFYEGGIRTPFIASWPAKFAGGRTIDTPVIALDILPTCLDAAGAAPPSGTVFDGKSLLPLLTAKTPPAERLHETFYWSSGGSEGEWAVRHGDWKVRSMKGKAELFDLAADPSEKRNLAAAHPDKLEELTALYEAWLDEMADPMTKGVSKRWGEEDERELTPREQERLKKRMENKTQRDMEKKAEKAGINPAAAPPPAASP
jgi:arylsulfatase A-like enzyme